MPIESVIGARAVVLIPSVAVASALAPLEVLIQEGLSTISLPADGQLRANDVRAMFGQRLRVGIHNLATLDQVHQALWDEVAFALTRHVEIAELMAAGLPTFTSALTPTEVLAASRAASGVVVEPVNVLGRDYAVGLRAIAGDVPLLVRGLPDVFAARDWLRVGAGLCLDSVLGDAFSGGDLSALRLRLRSFTEAMAEAG